MAAEVTPMKVKIISDFFRKIFQWNDSDDKPNRKMLHIE